MPIRIRGYFPVSLHRSDPCELHRRGIRQRGSNHDEWRCERCGLRRDRRRLRQPDHDDSHRRRALRTRIAELRAKVSALSHGTSLSR